MKEGVRGGWHAQSLNSPAPSRKKYRKPSLHLGEKKEERGKKKERVKKNERRKKEEKVKKKEKMKEGRKSE